MKWLSLHTLIILIHMTKQTSVLLFGGRRSALIFDEVGLSLTEPRMGLGIPDTLSIACLASSTTPYEGNIKSHSLQLQCPTRLRFGLLKDIQKCVSSGSNRKSVASRYTATICMPTMLVYVCLAINRERSAYKVGGNFLFRSLQYCFLVVFTNCFSDIKRNAIGTNSAKYLGFTDWSLV